MRQCGECSVCCVIGAVPELEKPAHTPCQYIKKDACGSCSIFNRHDLPNTCKKYRCAWLQGYGSEDCRPDKSNVLFTDNILENQRYFTAIENEKDAIFSSEAIKVWLEISNKTHIPIIVVKYGMKPPADTGDYVIVHNNILHRCMNIVGDLIHIKDEVGIYKLIKGK